MFADSNPKPNQNPNPNPNPDGFNINKLRKLIGQVGVVAFGGALLQSIAIDSIFFADGALNTAQISSLLALLVVGAIIIAIASWGK